MNSPVLCDYVTAFPSTLGWMAVFGRGRLLSGVSFGHPSEAAAWAAVQVVLRDAAEPGEWNAPLVERLQAYADGVHDDFLDIAIDEDGLTDFARRVIHQCRRVAYGETISYGQLASRVGAPAAARAVGNVMAANRCPLVVPCHRIVAADAQLGGYSAPGGTQVKQRLLAMESAHARSRSAKPRRRAGVTV